MTGEFKLFKIPIPLWSYMGFFFKSIFGFNAWNYLGVPLGLFMGLNRFAKGFFDPIVELYRPVPPLAWAPLLLLCLELIMLEKFSYYLWFLFQS